MLKMFKRSYALYWILVIPGAIAIYAAIWQKYPHSNLALLAIPLIAIWIYAVATIAEIYALKLNEKIIALLTEECNPKDYIAFYEKALKTKKFNKIKNFILLNLNTGYHSSGDAEESKRILDMVNGFPSTKSGAVNSVCYFNNLAGYYLRINDLENAENTLGNMKEALKNPKLNRMNYEIYYQLYNSKNVILNMLRGNYGGAEDHFNILFDKEKSLLGKVSAKYSLGELYLRVGNNEKDMLAYEYVLQNGKETYYAKKASEYLGKPLAY